MPELKFNENGAAARKAKKKKKQIGIYENFFYAKYSWNLLN